MKLKLEIQRFNSTNQTTHYELSQYTANDKPTYLIDYNGDMAKIDTAIYGADARSQVNTGAIGDLTTLETTAKSDLVSAVNEIKSATDTNTSNISTNTSNISTLGTNQGTMANLTTTDKTSLVSAINEVNAVNQTQNTQITQNTNDIAKFNLTTFDDIGVAEITPTNMTISSSTLKLATDSTNSNFKLYGTLSGSSMSTSADNTFKFSTNLRPDSNITINGAGIVMYYGTGGQIAWIRQLGFTVKTNGDIECNIGYWTVNSCVVMFMANLYLLKDFGDIPE